MTATVSYAAVCSVGYDELSPDTARANRWRPAGQPGLFFYIVRDQKADSFSRPARVTLSKHLHMRRFARALRSGWAFCWRAPRAADCSLSLERKTDKYGHICFARADGPELRGVCYQGV